MKQIWQNNFATFAGPGIHQPSNLMRVTDEEATRLLAELVDLRWQAPVFLNNGWQTGYRICHADHGWNTALLHGQTMIGFYAGSYLWITPEYRGCGLSTPLILAAAEQRGGSVMPPGIVCQGYTPRGLDAHRTAHRSAVLAALAARLPVPSSIVDEIHQHPGHARFGRQAA